MLLQLVRVRYWFLDSEEAWSDCNFWLEPTEVSGDWSKVVAFADALGDKLAALSDCQLIAYDIIVTYWQSVDIYAFTTPLYEHGAFIFETVAGTRYIVAVPALDPAKLDTDGLTLLQADADVSSFVDMILNGDGTIAPAFNGDDIDSLNAAYLQIRPVSGIPVAG